MVEEWSCVQMLAKKSDVHMKVDKSSLQIKNVKFSQKLLSIILGRTGLTCLVESGYLSTHSKEVLPTFPSGAVTVPYCKSTLEFRTFEDVGHDMVTK